MAGGIQGLGLTRRERIDGNALFSAVAFALCVGLIAALERVGAPDGFSKRWDRSLRLSR